MSAAPLRRRRPESTRERILEAGLHSFAEQGFDGTTTKEIARRAGVNEVTLFRLFRSKKDLFHTVLAEFSPLTDIKRDVTFEPDGSLDDLMVENAKIALSTLRQNKHLLMVFFGDSWRRGRGASVLGDAMIEQGIEFLSEFMKRQMDSGRMRRVDPRTAARAWLGMIQSYFIVNDMIGGKKPDPPEEDRMIRAFVSIFLDGTRMEGAT